MILFPNAKINIGLQILSKRPDGYHDICTFFYPAPVYDILEIIKSDDDLTDITVTGVKEKINLDDNLCMKAYNILSDNYKIPPVKIYLHKIIPIGAGLAGGSSDAAHTLKALNILFNLHISNHDLITIASKLGSDCAFFIDNKPSIATSRGEILSPFDINLNRNIIIVTPDIQISTAKAYSMVTPNSNVPSLQQLIKQDIHTWKDTIINDFEGQIFIKYSKIKVIKEQLYNMGALYASMSGSGSSVYGIFKRNPDIGNYFSSYRVFCGTI